MVRRVDAPAHHATRAAGLLIILLAAAAVGGGQSQVVPFRPPKNNATTCFSITQCYMMGLGAPRLQGEWMTAYMAALHEHCINLLLVGGPKDCSSSIRCVYLLPNGTIVPPDRSSSNGSGGSAANGASALLLSSSDAEGSSSSVQGSQESVAAAGAAYWKSAASALQLKQPACLPDPSLVQGLRFRACTWQRGNKFQEPNRPLEQLSDMCHSDFTSCFIRNGSLAGDVEAWWTGAAPKRFLEPDSSWTSSGKIQEVAQRCADSWHTPDRHVADMCATRGVGPAPWNNSLLLNRVIVALVDAFESSGCNNTVTFSEAMAVQQIVRDLCTGAGCQPKASRSPLVHSGVAWRLLAVVLAVAMLLW